MTVENRKAEKYGVAHNDVVLQVFDTVDEAKRQEQHFSETAESIGMRPSYQVVTVTETVTYGKPKVYVEPDPEQPTETTETTDGDAGDPPTV